MDWFKLCAMTVGLLLIAIWGAAAIMAARLDNKLRAPVPIEALADYERR